MMESGECKEVDDDDGGYDDDDDMLDLRVRA